MRQYEYLQQTLWHQLQPPLPRIFCRGAALTVISLLIASLLVGCGGSTGTATALSGHVMVVGSTALQPLATAAASLFQKQHPQVQIEVQGGGSLSGLKAVTSQQADIGDSDVYADPAIYSDPNLTDHIVCVIPFAMVVAPDIPVLSLTPHSTPVCRLSP